MLKKILFLLAIIAIITTACGTAEAGKQSRFTNYSGSHMEISEDTVTGCKYLVYSISNKGGITPLLKSDGTVDCD